MHTYMNTDFVCFFTCIIYKVYHQGNLPFLAELFMYVYILMTMKKHHDQSDSSQILLCSLFGVINEMNKPEVMHKNFKI